MVGHQNVQIYYGKAVMLPTLKTTALDFSTAGQENFTHFA